MLHCIHCKWQIDRKSSHIIIWHLSSSVLWYRAAQAQQTRVVGTEVELSVVFNRSVPASALPLNTVVAQTLVDAANDSNAFNVTFGASSVLLVCK